MDSQFLLTIFVALLAAHFCSADITDSKSESLSTGHSAHGQVGRRLLLTTSATGSLSLQGATGLCASGGYTSCLRTATFANAGTILKFNLTGPGCRSVSSPEASA